MTILERFLGLISAPVYALQRSKLGPLRLRVAALWLGLAGAAYLAFRGWRNGFPAVYLAGIVVCLLWTALLEWVNRQHYLVFRVHPLDLPQPSTDLRAEEKLLVSGSGHFEVSDMRRYLVQVPVVFWSTELAEHIVAAKVSAWNLAGIGVPDMERGWWYVFLEPPHVLEIEVGTLCFGLRQHPAVRVRYTGNKHIETLYLSSDDPARLARLIKELRDKASPFRREQHPSEGH